MQIHFSDELKFIPNANSFFLSNSFACRDWLEQLEDDWIEEHQNSDSFQWQLNFKKQQFINRELQTIIDDEKERLREESGAELNRTKAEITSILESQNQIWLESERQRLEELKNEEIANIRVEFENNKTQSVPPTPLIPAKDQYQPLVRKDGTIRYLGQYGTEWCFVKTTSVKNFRFRTDKWFTTGKNKVVRVAPCNTVIDRMTLEVLDIARWKFDRRSDPKLPKDSADGSKSFGYIVHDHPGWNQPFCLYVNNKQKKLPLLLQPCNSKMNNQKWFHDKEAGRVSLVNNRDIFIARSEKPVDFLRESFKFFKHVLELKCVRGYQEEVQLDRRIV